MVKILNEIMKSLPSEKISSIEFEGANIVIYTNNSKFLFEGRSILKKLVERLKKRIELRSDPKILLNEEDSKKFIGEVLKDVKVSDIKFEFARSCLTIEVDNVGLAIGKEGCNLKELQKKTLWLIEIKKTPIMKSKTVSAMREVEFSESEYRRKFLNKVGKKIYGGWETGKIKKWARITMLGAAKQIGRSCIYLQTPESRVLFDCGLDVTKPFDDNDAFPFFESPDFKLEDIDAIVLSHAHLDHCGLIPYLYKIGYRGPLYCTAPTRDLIALSLVDFVKIMHQNNSENVLYKIEDVKEMLKHTITIDYMKVSDITSNLRLTFYNAGHVLGSAFCHINIGNGVYNFLYTGDINYSTRQRLLQKATDTFPRIEAMLLEATSSGPQDYAKNRDEAEEDFLKALIDSYVNKSKILLPVFGIGRSQEMLLCIEEFIRLGRLPKDFKVYVDGMIYEVCAIHSSHPNFLNMKLRNRLNNNENPFLNETFIEVNSHEHREEILEKNEQALIIATSGMLNAGPSLEYFKKLAPNEKNAILFCGYQSQGTIGRRVKDGEKEILLTNTGSENDKVKVNLQVYEMQGAFSGHNDLPLNKKFLGALTPKPRKIILNHGDPIKLESFSNYVKKNNKSRSLCP